MDQSDGFYGIKNLRNKNYPLFNNMNQMSQLSISCQEMAANLTIFSFVTVIVSVAAVVLNIAYHLTFRLVNLLVYKDKVAYIKKKLCNRP